MGLENLYSQRYIEKDFFVLKTIKERGCYVVEIFENLFKSYVIYNFRQKMR